MKVRFGKWLPDLPYYENPGLVEANNVIPSDSCYKDFLTLQTEGTSLNSRPQGAYAATDIDGSPNIFAGDDKKLYERVSTAWTDRSASTYNTASNGYWRFTQFKQFVIATNFVDAIQSIDTSTTGSFAALSSEAPKARQIGVINNFVIVGDTDDTANGVVPYRTEWCAIGNASNWPTPGSASALALQSGEQFNNSAFGAVTGIAGFQFYGLVFQQRGINRYTYVGGSEVFQIQAIDTSRGCWAPQSLVQVGQLCYFLAADGFYVTDGQMVKPIGSGVIDKTFYLDFDQSYRERMTAAVDIVNKVIFWAYPSHSAASGVPDKLIMYNFAEDRWARADDTVQLIFSSLSTGYSLDDLDTLFSSIDDMTVSLDSSMWTGGIPVVMGFASNKLGSFSGAANDATIETGEIDLEKFVYMDGVRPKVTGSPTSITCAIAVRDNQDNESRTFGSPVARNSRTGMSDFREQGRYASVRVEIEGEFDSAIGVDVSVLEGDGV